MQRQGHGATAARWSLAVFPLHQNSSLKLFRECQVTCPGFLFAVLTPPWLYPSYFTACVSLCPRAQGRDEIRERKQRSEVTRQVGCSAITSFFSFRDKSRAYRRTWLRERGVKVSIALLHYFSYSVTLFLSFAFQCFRASGHLKWVFSRYLHMWVRCTQRQRVWVWVCECVREEKKEGGYVRARLVCVSGLFVCLRSKKRGLQVPRLISLRRPARSKIRQCVS